LGQEIVICLAGKSGEFPDIDMVRVCFWSEYPLRMFIAHHFGASDQKGSEILPRKWLNASGKRSYVLHRIHMDRPFRDVLLRKTVLFFEATVGVCVFFSGTQTGE
jgi:hypothetical protein